MAELSKPITDDQKNNNLIFFSKEANFHLSGVANK